LKYKVEIRKIIPATEIKRVWREGGPDEKGMYVDIEMPTEQTECTYQQIINDVADKEIIAAIVKAANGFK